MAAFLAASWPTGPCRPPALQPAPAKPCCAGVLLNQLVPSWGVTLLLIPLLGYLTWRTAGTAAKLHHAETAARQAAASGVEGAAPGREAAGEQPSALGPLCPSPWPQARDLLALWAVLLCFQARAGPAAVLLPGARGGALPAWRARGVRRAGMRRVAGQRARQPRRAGSANRQPSGCELSSVQRRCVPPNSRHAAARAPSTPHPTTTTTHPSPPNPADGQARLLAVHLAVCRAVRQPDSGSPGLQRLLHLAGEVPCGPLTLRYGASAVCI